MRIQADKEIVGLDGKPMLASANDSTSATVGKVIANILIGPKTPEKKFDSFKALELGRKFYGDSIVIVDKADFGIIEKMVEKNKMLHDLVLGQVMETLADAREDGAE